jgi:hypothetical protein
MTDNRKELSHREMSMKEGVRPTRDAIRHRVEKSLADLNVRNLPVRGEPGYHRVYGEETKLVPEASLIGNSLDAGRREARCPMWIG